MRVSDVIAVVAAPTTVIDTIKLEDADVYHECWQIIKNSLLR